MAGCTAIPELAPLPRVQVLNPDGAHAIAVRADAPFEIDVMGHAGYYVAGMNKHARVTVHGNAGTGAAENMMCGEVRIKGFASTSAGASAHGGCLIIEGDASLRCGISLKGADIVVGGNVGSFSAFMAQAGRLVICGDAGEALGDSLYEAVIYVRGKVASLGADARFEDMTPADLDGAGMRCWSAPASRTTRAASARWHRRAACITGTPTPTRSIEVEESASFDRNTIDYIQRASATGLYEIRGMGAKRRLPHFDDLLLLGASLSRYPLEGYREKCITRTVLGIALSPASRSSSTSPSPSPA